MDRITKYLFFVVLTTSFILYDVDAGPPMARAKRASGGFNIMQFLMKAEQIIDGCKIKNASQSTTNGTNPIVKFVEGHNLNCIFDGFMKLFKEMGSSNQTRTKRDAGGSNIFMELLTLREDLKKCKKPNPATNETNPFLKFVDEYDLNCVMRTIYNFGVKMIPKDPNTRTKRDSSGGNILQDLSTLREDLMKCKKPGVQSNETNPFLKFLDEYDVNCIVKTLFKFGQKFDPNNPNHRSKRELNMNDITCMARKLVDAGPEAEKVIKAFARGRSKREETTPACEDFGKFIDAFLKLIMNFAPKAPAS